VDGENPNKNPHSKPNKKLDPDERDAWEQHQGRPRLVRLWSRCRLRRRGRRGSRYDGNGKDGVGGDA
jgi:hypothetical protein